MKYLFSKYTILTVLVVSFLNSCAIKLPKITATGERTALENQIIGSYKIIESEAMLISSVRSESSSDSLRFTEEKRKVLDSFRRQKFNADDIIDFKKEGVIGEKTDGLLEIRENTQYGSDSVYQALVDRIVQQENLDRVLIMKRIVQLHPEIDPDDHAKVGYVYALLKQEASPPGTWIQNQDGSWHKK